MTLNRIMDTQNMIHLRNGVLLNRKNNGNLKLTGKCMEVEENILSEVTQYKMKKKQVMSSLV